MKTAPTFLLLASFAAVTGLTSCGTTEPASTSTSSSAAEASAEGDITNPAQARNSSHLSKAAAKVQNGVTTRKDVLHKLGMFYKKGTDASGRATATWTYKENQGTAKAWIPGSAFIPGAVVTYYQSLTLVLDANDVVVSHQFLESTKEKTGLGFSYGS